MRHLHRVVCFLFILGLISFQGFISSAADVRYVYDELGRLVAVIDTAGQTAIYNYDAVGNLLSITTQSSSTVAILEFTPNSGAIGTTVTIWGNGFSATPSQNTVKFNGVTASVTSSTVNQIVTTVPVGTTTGLISVTCPGGSASSSSSFVVNTGPLISGLAPTAGATGASVTITGSNFASTPTQNTVSFNLTTGSVISGNPISIIASVPNGATSGHIKVTTPVGQATSTQDFFVAPSPYIGGDVGYSDRITTGQNRNVVLTPHKVGMLVFDGNSSQQVSLNFSAVTIPVSLVSVYKPDGSPLLSPTSVNTSGGTLGPLTLPTTGTYTILIAPIEAITTIAGIGDGDGFAATIAKLQVPTGTAIDSSGNVYIADASNYRIRKVSTSGTITTVAGTGIPGYSGDGGPATSARIDNARGVAVDGSGNIYIADRNNQRIRKVSTSGIITTIAGTGTGGFSGDGGPAADAMISSPEDVFVDSSGNLFLADTNNYRIRKINTSGIITTIAGTGSSTYNGDGISALSANISAYGVFVDSSGNVFIASSTQHRIRKVDTSGIISTIAGNGTSGFSGDAGQATLAKINSPQSVWVDASGNLYIADKNNQRIRRVATTGIITTFAGNGTGGYSGDGGAATSAMINAPEGVMADSTGNLFISDSSNFRIRKVNTSGIISTFAGAGTSGGFGGDGGPATSARIWSPGAVAADASGNVLISDTNNNRIRKVNTAGTITTIAGTGVAGFSGDGGAATSAKINNPGRLAFDSFGEIQFTDSNNNRIRKIKTNGIIVTVAGTGISGFSGDGAEATGAKIASPTGISFDQNGDYYLGDNRRVRKVTNYGLINTIAGNGDIGYYGDGGPAANASFDSTPGSVWMDSQGRLFVTDSSDDRVRKIQSSGSMTLSLTSP